MTQDSTLKTQFLDAVAVAMITPGPGSHHGCLHRLSRFGYGRRLCGGPGSLLAGLSVRCSDWPFLRAILAKHSSPSLCARRHGSRNRRNRRRGRGSRQTLNPRLLDGWDCSDDLPDSREMDDPRTRHHPGCWLVGSGDPYSMKPTAALQV